jgi:ABC-type transport system involved in multi-copper enzyme maturation permease subunit
MKTLITKLEMPLLARELKELAARKRTYITRFVYAGLLFLMACGVLFGDPTGNSSDGLGRGREMFRLLLLVQFWGMVILVPATTAGVITIEKERDALGVLMLTTLGSVRIVLQKLLSRLVPMFSFLLLGLPLIAVAYSHGGVPDGLLFWGVVVLFMSAIHLGVISLFCSVWSATTAQALLQTWILFAVSYFILQPIWLPWVIDSPGAADPSSAAFAAAAAAFWSGVLSIAGFVAAAMFLNSRAFASSENHMLKLFKVLDKFFNEANAVTGGVILVRDQNQSPRFHPVAWRETARKSLGTFRYQFRVLACLEIPILFVCQQVRLTGSGSASSVQITLMTLWCVTLLLVAVHGASLVSSERSRQTLNVLLTTPITGPSLLTQKWAGLRRMLFVLFVPFASVYLFQAWFMNDRNWIYVVYSMLSYAVLLPAAAWLSIWIGLRTKSQIRAILVSLAAIGAFALIPFGLRLAMAQPGSQLAEFLSVLSPMEMVIALEFGTPAWLRGHHLQLAVFLGIFFVIGIGLRLACRFQIDKRLGRVPLNFKPNKTFQPQT